MLRSRPRSGRLSVYSTAPQASRRCVQRCAMRHAQTRAPTQIDMAPAAPNEPRPQTHFAAHSQLRGGEHAPYVVLLELFCYGTWPDYKGAGARA